jgi:hypothetical protein
MQPIAREFGLTIWDQSKVRAGENEKQLKNENLVSSEIFICLISPNYYADQTILNEIESIIENANSSNGLILPIIMRDAYNESSPFADYKPIVYNELPIFSSYNIDEALVYAIYQIRDSIERFNLKNSI